MAGGRLSIVTAQPRKMIFRSGSTHCSVITLRSARTAWATRGTITSSALRAGATPRRRVMLLQ